LAAAPIFIVDLYSVFGCDVAHIFSLLLMVHCCLPRFSFDKNQVRRPSSAATIRFAGKRYVVYRDEKDDDHEFLKKLHPATSSRLYRKWNGVKTRMGKILVRFVIPPAAFTSSKTSLRFARPSDLNPG